MIPLIRFVGYFLAIAAVDITIDTVQELRRRKMERKLKRYENKNGAEVYAHTVTEDTEGAVMTPGGGSHEAKTGDVLIATNRPDVFDVAASDFADEYTERAEDEATEPTEAEDSDVTFADDDEESEPFNPVGQSAYVVANYINRMDAEGNAEERDRVIAAERAGSNRKTALGSHYVSE